MKNKVLNFLRSKRFQPLWEKLFHYSKIGMNLWGGAALNESGEKYALKYAKAKVKSNTDKNKLFIIFDVGAYRGQYAILASQFLKNKTLIFSFEPSKDAFNVLNKNISDAELTSKIKTFNIGMGEQIKKLILHSSGQVDSQASLYNLQKHGTAIDKQFKKEVTINTIDEFCKENNIDKIDYLKLDVEGHELYVLKGTNEMISKRKIKYIQFEFGFCNIDSKVFFRDFYDLLSANYNFYSIVSDGLRPIKEYSYDLEIFNIANYLAELKKQ